MPLESLHIHTNLMNYCFNKVGFLHFYNKLKFHVFVQRWENAPAITRNQNLNSVGQSGHSTFVLSAIEMFIARIIKQLSF